MRRAAIVLVGTVFAAMLGCRPPYVPPPPYPAFAADPAEYAPFLAGGTGTLTGQVFAKTRGGDVKLGAGNPVTLDPVSAYSTMGWTTRANFGRYYLAEFVPDTLFRRARRSAIVDAQGRFKFTGLAEGAYYVRSIVEWETGGAYTPRQGGLAGRRVEVKAASETEVMLNP